MELDKRDRRAIRRILAGASTLESLPGYRREKLSLLFVTLTKEELGALAAIEK